MTFNVKEYMMCHKNTRFYTIWTSDGWNRVGVVMTGGDCPVTKTHVHCPCSSLLPVVSTDNMFACQP